MHYSVGPVLICQSEKETPVFTSSYGILIPENLIIFSTKLFDCSSWISGKCILKVSYGAKLRAEQKATEFGHCWAKPIHLRAVLCNSAAFVG